MCTVYNMKLKSGGSSVLSLNNPILNIWVVSQFLNILLLFNIFGVANPETFKENHNF